MSMLSTQIDNLRLMARLVLDYEPAEIRRALREAADTIESLRDRLQNLAFERGMNDALEALRRSECEDTRWFELFGTPEKVARTLADNCPGGPCGGCPGLKAEECGLGDYDVLLEWLRGKAVKR